MKELSIQEIKDIELSLLIQFNIICINQQLRYSLGGGTLLGAIRHNGFIPWDDDVDVMMPRPDYDKFLKYCRDNPIPFFLVCHEDNPNYKNLFAKVVAPNTTIIDTSINTESTEMGVHIDVFPIDGLGQSNSEAIKRFKKSKIKREVLNAATWERYFKSKTHAWYYEPIRFLLFIVSRFVNPTQLMDKIDDINRSIDFETSQYAGCVSGAYREKEIMATKVFQNYTEVRFEKYDFKAIKAYDAYLKQHYGDYMLLPPEEKRVTHHTFKVYSNEGLK